MSSLSQGIHNAVCIGIIFTGKHQSFNRPLPKVTILWEITENEKIKLFQEIIPILITRRQNYVCTQSLGEADLLQRLNYPNSNFAIYQACHANWKQPRTIKITNKQKMFTVFQQRNKLLNANQSLFTLIYQIKRLIQKYLIYHIIQQKRSKTHLSINNRHLNYNITKHIGHSSVMLSVFFYTRKEKHHEY